MLLLLRSDLKASEAQRAAEGFAVAHLGFSDAQLREEEGLRKRQALQGRPRKPEPRARRGRNMAAGGSRAWLQGFKAWKGESRAFLAASQGCSWSCKLAGGQFKPLEHAQMSSQDRAAKRLLPCVKGLASIG